MQCAVNSCISAVDENHVQMERMKVLILLSCAYNACASHQPHTIPVEGYETELQVLGQHVEIPETPVKIIKITKTVAVKIPVPYHVKVREKVPYPVHVSKPYPVPVPQIVKIPVPIRQEQGSDNSGHNAVFPLGSGHQFNQGGSQYQVQELNSYEHPATEEHTNFGNDHSSYEGYSGNDYGDGVESQNYDKIIQNYLRKNDIGGLNSNNP